jgi:hypothetical protein
MEICNIIPHQGYGDLFNLVGLINYYSTIYSKINVIVLDSERLELLNEIFKFKNNIDIKIPIFKNYEQTIHPETCINCMNYGNTGNNCRNKVKCKYINYNNSQVNIKIGSFNQIEKWFKFKESQFSFVHAFYNYLNLDPIIRINHFKLFNDKLLETSNYKKFISKYGVNYILTHQDLNRNLKLNIPNPNNLPIINLDKISKLMVDYIEIIKHSKEIHLIDSSWSVLIYLLTPEYLSNIPIYLNQSLAIQNGRDINIYKNPTFNNWTFY